LSAPLAERMRPTELNEYIGQDHLIGEQGILRKSLDHGRISSMILWGPPGVGKTTLANLLAKQQERTFYSLSAINSGVKDVGRVRQYSLLTKYTDLVKVSRTPY